MPAIIEMTAKGTARQARIVGSFDLSWNGAIYKDVGSDRCRITIEEKIGVALAIAASLQKNDRQWYRRDHAPQ